jgi:hypothetical protein
MLEQLLEHITTIHHTSLANDRSNLQQESLATPNMVCAVSVHPTTSN